MTTGIQYDEAWANRLEAVYKTPDVVGQRQAVLQALAAQTGEHILDIGSGPGMLTRQIAQEVGRTGRVVGIDTSEPMNQLAAARTADLPWVTIRNCDATNLPFSDNQFDAAVSTQVYEYIEDIEAALSELYRVLKPGGRAIILDTDWDTLIWNTADRPRLQRIMDIFAPHCAHPYLGRQLPPLLRKAGFTLESTNVYTILNTKYAPNTYSYGIIDFIANYVLESGRIPPEEVQTWRNELETLGKSNAYFFSNNRYLFTITKVTS